MSRLRRCTVELPYDPPRSLQIPIRLRERYVTEEDRTVLVEGIGEELQITIPSERRWLTIRIPAVERIDFEEEERTLTGNNSSIIRIGRYTDAIPNQDRVEATVITRLP